MNLPLFPEDVLKLGHYLGLSIDLDPAMAAKILTQNGQMLHRFMYRPLTPDVASDQEGSDDHKQFMAREHE